MSEIETAGFVPKNRREEDGEIPAKYPNLTETATSDPAERTELNVINSDATPILSRGALAGGSRLTREFAGKHRKLFLHVDLSLSTIERAARETAWWLARIDCRVLNVAGPRASEDAEIYAKTREFLEKLFIADFV